MVRKFLSSFFGGKFWQLRPFVYFETICKFWSYILEGSQKITKFLQKVGKNISVFDLLYFGSCQDFFHDVYYRKNNNWYSFGSLKIFSKFFCYILENNFQKNQYDCEKQKRDFKILHITLWLGWNFFLGWFLLKRNLQIELFFDTLLNLVHMPGMVRPKASKILPDSRKKTPYLTFYIRVAIRNFLRKSLWEVIGSRCIFDCLNIFCHIVFVILRNNSTNN